MKSPSMEYWGGRVSAAVSAFAVALASVVGCAMWTSPLADLFEPNDSLVAAADISSQRGVQIDCVSSDEDWFAISVPSGETVVSVDITFDYVRTDIDAALYDASGARLSVSAAVLDNEHIVHDVAVAGTYYVQTYVLSGLYRGAPYTLIWEASAP